MTRNDNWITILTYKKKMIILGNNEDKLIFVTPNIVTAKAILIKISQTSFGKREAHQVIKN